MLRRLLLTLVLIGLPAVAVAQAKGAAPVLSGCARYTEPEKKAKCQAAEARAAKDAERKRIDQQRRAERRCAKAADDKARTECEKKELGKGKG